MKRPLVPVALLYVGGILIARFISLPPLLLLAVSLGLAVLALAWPRAWLVRLYGIRLMEHIWNRVPSHCLIASQLDSR